MRKLFISYVAHILFIIICSPSSSANTLGASINFVKTIHDYGVIEAGSDGTYEFVFTNSGSAPLVLRNVQSSCGCAITEWPREPIPIGEKSIIKVEYDTQKIGSFSKSIKVYSNGSDQPVVLQIKGIVQNSML